MNNKTLMHSSILAAIMIAAIIGVSMVTGLPGAQPFVTVDPLSDKTAGDTFTITGTTNLPAGTDIMVQVYASSFEKNTNNTGEFSGAVGTVRTVAGTGGINTWSMDVDTSVFVPMEYLVNASVSTGDSGNGEFSSGSPFGTTTFTVRPGPGRSTPRGSDTGLPAGIRINPIYDTPVGTDLEVTGVSGLPAGSSLLVKVMPSTMENGNFTENYERAKISEVIRVVQGDGKNNRFSATLETRSLPAGEYIILVLEGDGAAAGTGSKSTGWTGSALFNIVTGTGPSGNSLPAGTADTACTTTPLNPWTWVPESYTPAAATKTPPAPGTSVSKADLFGTPSLKWQEYRGSQKIRGLPDSSVISRTAIVMETYPGKSVFQENYTYVVSIPELGAAQTNIDENTYDENGNMVAMHRRVIVDNKIMEDTDYPPVNTSRGTEYCSGEVFSPRYTYAGTDPVTVPAGSYPGAMKYVLQEDDTGSTPATVTYWFAPGVPVPVKRVIDEPDKGNLFTYELKGWE